MCIRDRLHGQQLVAEEGLILGKQDNSGNIQFQASLKQIIFHSGIVALENMADISVLRKNGLDAVDPVSYTHLDVYKRQAGSSQIDKPFFGYGDVPQLSQVFHGYADT